MTGTRHTHRISGQVLTHDHPGGDREHTYYQHHEDAVHITCDHDDQPVDWVGRTFGQLTPDEKRRAARQAGKQMERELRQMAPAIEAVMEMEDEAWAGRGFTGPPAAPDPLPEEHYHWATDGRPGARTQPPCRCGTPSLAHRPGLLRDQLRKFLAGNGMSTLAYIESAFLGHGPWHRNDIINTLAAMRDDGEVRFEGPRYVLADPDQEVWNFLDGTGKA